MNEKVYISKSGHFAMLVIGPMAIPVYNILAIELGPTQLQQITEACPGETIIFQPSITIRIKDNVDAKGSAAFVLNDDDLRAELVRFLESNKLKLE